MLEKLDYYMGDKTRPLHIHLPNDYDQTSETYPVMYFFDGHNLYNDKEATYGKSWGLEDFLNQWHKPIIAVGVECGHGQGERLEEYCPYRVTLGQVGEINGTGDETMHWLVQDVKPFIDANYRTQPFRECTGIGGSSMGGLMSAYAVIKYNACFSKAACLSSVLYQEELQSDLDKSDISPDTRVYLSWGTEEIEGDTPEERRQHTQAFADSNYQFEQALQSRDVTTMTYQLERGRHREADWERQNPIYMHFLWDE